jgi:hypothetical protein
MKLHGATSNKAVTRFKKDQQSILKNAAKTDNENMQKMKTSMRMVLE